MRRFVTMNTSPSHMTNERTATIKPTTMRTANMMTPVGPVLKSGKRKKNGATMRRSASARPGTNASAWRLVNALTFSSSFKSKTCSSLNMQRMLHYFSAFRHFQNRLPSFFRIAPRYLPAACDGHDGLAPLPRDEDNVSRLCHLHGETDRVATIENAVEVMPVLFPGLDRAVRDVIDDLPRIVVVRIFVRHDDDACLLPGDPTQDRSSRHVTPASGGPEHVNDAAVTVRCHNLVQFRHRDRFKRKINDNSPWLPLVDPFVSSWETGHVTQRSRRVTQRDTERFRGRERRKRILNIPHPWHSKRHGPAVHFERDVVRRKHDVRRNKCPVPRSPFPVPDAIPGNLIKLPNHKIIRIFARSIQHFHARHRLPVQDLRRKERRVLEQTNFRAFVVFKPAVRFDVFRPQVRKDARVVRDVFVPVLHDPLRRGLDHGVPTPGVCHLAQEMLELETPDHGHL